MMDNKEAAGRALLHYGSFLDQVEDFTVEKQLASNDKLFAEKFEAFLTAGRDMTAYLKSVLEK